MALEGYKGLAFVVKLRMETTIYANHTVKIKGPGVAISKDTGPLEELTYGFTPDDWDTDQDINVLGFVPGTYTLFCSITSPFYESFNKLKIKKDEIQIRILEEIPDGWHGDKHGLRFGTGDEFGCVDNEMFLSYTVTPEEGSASIKIIANALANSMSVVCSGGLSGFFENVGSASTVGLSFSLPTPGPYIFKVYLNGNWGTSTLGSISATWFKNGVEQDTVSGQQRGLQVSTGDTDSTPFNVNFSAAFATPVNQYEPYLSFNFTPPFNVQGVPYTGVPPENFSGSVSYADGTGFTASGQWKNYFGGSTNIGAGATSTNHPTGASPVGISGVLSKI